MDLGSWLDANLFSILNGVARGLLLFTIASGLSLALGTMNTLNLAHGAMYLWGGYIAFEFFDGTMRSVGVAILVAIAFGAVAGGTLAGLLLPVVRHGYLTQTLLTLGCAYILADLASMVWGNDIQTVDPPGELAEAIWVLDQPYPTYRLAVIATGIAIALLLYVVVSRTRVGIRIRAAAADREILGAMGVNVRRLFVATFVGASVFAAIGGVLAAPILGVYPGLDTEALVLSLLIVVIGGLGSLKGAFVAALIVGQSQTTLVSILPEYSAFALFGLVGLIMLLRPSGLWQT